MNKKKLKKVLAFFVVLGCLCFAWGINETVFKPFPFLNVEYVNISGWDSPPSSFEKIQLSEPLPLSLETVVHELKGLNDFELQVEYATSITRNIMLNSEGNDIRTSARDILSEDQSLMRICSEFSKVFATLMQLTQIPSRVVWMDGHTVSEVWNQNKWILIDTWGNVRCYDINGEKLGLREVVQNYSSVNFSKVVEDNHHSRTQYLDTGYLTSDRNVYQNQKLFLVVSGNDLFDFHAKTRDMGHILKSIIMYDDASVGEARQLVLDNYYVGNFGIRSLKRFASIP